MSINRDSAEYPNPESTGLGGGVASAPIYTGDVLAIADSKFIRVSNTATNKPIVADGYVRTLRRSGTYKTVEFISDDNVAYRNTMKNGNWSGWVSTDPQTFGVGVEDGPLITDFNDAEMSGFYSTASTANNPGGLGTAFGMLHVVSRSAGNTAQTFTQSTATTTIYTRVQVSNTWSDWQPVYTGANYQPEIKFGIGVVRKMRNNTGAAVSDGTTNISGTLLDAYYIDPTGTSLLTGQSGGSGTLWKNVSGSNIGNGNGADFVRVS